MLPYYLDIRGNSRANTCYKSRLLEEMYLLDSKPTQQWLKVIHINSMDCTTLSWQWFIQISALSTFDGRIEAYHGING